MAYNKAREEKKWRLWKEAEEKQLRSLGVSEDTIEQLRVHDWAIFNSDRRYYQRMQEWKELLSVATFTMRSLIPLSAQNKAAQDLYLSFPMI